MTLSDTQFSILRQAAQHPDGLAASPSHLPPRPRASIARALLNAGLVARAKESDAGTSWKLDGEAIWLAITDTGREAIDPPAEEQAGTAQKAALGEEEAAPPDVTDAGRQAITHPPRSPSPRRHTAAHTRKERQPRETGQSQPLRAP